jgi:hypothetical protein
MPKLRYTRYRYQGKDAINILLISGKQRQDETKPGMVKGILRKNEENGCRPKQ